MKNENSKTKFLTIWVYEIPLISVIKVVHCKKEKQINKHKVIRFFVFFSICFNKIETVDLLASLLSLQHHFIFQYAVPYNYESQFIFILKQAF